ncbi:hypothetical protein [Rubrobacter indicoceani]|uniref:hypothetical protein n=1 Tax=Rubrobacter indicoceani TaxID=2051957 RepID=UPI0013C51DC9|nr:hypothetical protein [Rubrobacter indicoceani]
MESNRLTVQADGLPEVLRVYRRTGMLYSRVSTEKTSSLESVLAEGGYTYFGRAFERLLKSRGLNQSSFAEECRRRGFEVGRLGKRRAVGQRSVSDWMHGKTACPKELPVYADAILGFSEEEWAEFGVAYAYGQTVSEEDFEDILQFRKFYSSRLSSERSSEGSPKG